jgi:hypothetical protein
VALPTKHLSLGENSMSRNLAEIVDMHYSEYIEGNLSDSTEARTGVLMRNKSQELQQEVHKWIGEVQQDLIAQNAEERKAFYEEQEAEVILSYWELNPRQKVAFSSLVQMSLLQEIHNFAKPSVTSEPSTDSLEEEEAPVQLDEDVVKLLRTICDKLSKP